MSANVFNINVFYFLFFFTSKDHRRWIAKPILRGFSIPWSTLYNLLLLDWLPGASVNAFVLQRHCRTYLMYRQLINLTIILIQRLQFCIRFSLLFELVLSLLRNVAKVFDGTNLVIVDLFFIENTNKFVSMIFVLILLIVFVRVRVVRI